PYLKDIPLYCKWFANGAATKKMYLTVSHTEDDGMNFSYHYQVAELNEKQVELFNYYLMRIIFRGVEEPNLSIGEIINIV
ncbi:MAG: chromosome condensation protein, partial [Pseudobutyrivibrio sp.]|nr:chromosome condensation protein [Pseudobutyrivibrio sp.]